MMIEALARDTAPHIEADLLVRLRATSPARKAQMIRGIHHGAARMVRLGVRRRSPSATDEQRRRTEAALWFGEAQVAALWPQAKEMFRMVDDPLLVALLVASILESLNISYCLCGALAAMLHGEPRTTRDIDLIADIRPTHVPELLDALNGLFFVQRSDLQAALAWAATDAAHHASFSMNHAKSLFKVDVFVPRRPFDRLELQRRIAQPLDDDSEQVLFVVTAEDTVLAKLEWYQLTPSDRQWRDVQTVLRVQAEALDLAYMRHWAHELGVSSALEAALRGERPPAAPADDTSTQLQMF